MVDIVRSETNTGAGAKWRRRAAAMAQRLAKNTSKYFTIDGFIVRAKRTGELRTASVIDLPPKLRLVGNLGDVPGEYLGSPKITVAATRDAFDPNFSAAPTVVPPEETDAAVYPNYATVFVGAEPDAYFVFGGGATPVHDRTQMWSTGRDTSETLMFRPVSDDVRVFARAEFHDKTDTAAAVVIDENFVTSVTGGYQMLGRKVVSGVAQAYPENLPYVSSYYRRELATVVTNTSVVRATQDSGIDYGATALFATRTSSFGEDGTATQLYLRTFPNVPQFEQPTWFPDPALGYVPAVVKHETLLRSDGVEVTYGTFFSFVYPTGGEAPTGRTGFRQMQTRFCFVAPPAGQPTWYVLSCAVSGFDTTLAPRRVNTAEGEFPWSECPSAFLGTTDTWAVYLTYQLSPLGMNYGVFGGTSTVSTAEVVIVKGVNIVASGMPPGVTMTRDIPNSRLVMALPERVGYRTAFMACHTDTELSFGVSFFGYDETTEALVLAYWDSVTGFGVWDFDLSELNAERPDRLPSISCYNRITSVQVDDEVTVEGTPSFIVNCSYSGTSKCFVIADGVAKLFGNFSPLATALLGNELQGAPLYDMYG